ncbi:MAG TPA: hypothetical protein VND91_08510 [Candidatus Saccharimonadia bacterium]|nr:hypothetical protein [Candidatus Saccharimonadia bacterium]
MKTLLLAAMLSTVGTAQARGDTQRAPWRATSAEAQIELNRAVPTQFGFEILPRGAKRIASSDDYVRHRFALTGTLEFEIANGHYAYPAEGALAPTATLTFVHGTRRAEPKLALRARAQGEGGLVFTDASGAVWLVATDVHQHFDAERGSLAMTHLDLQVGPALARWKRHAALEGRAIGVLHLTLSGVVDAGFVRAKQIAACNTPSWPGTPGTVADVALIAISDLDVYCDGALAGGPGNCSNTGTNPAAKLKFLPSVRLKNIGSADFPWYPKFSGTTPSAPYPYGTLDQHPFLVWNVYRLSADGRFEQIARSGVKHGFATGNENCSCPNQNILAPQCEDPYDASSNDWELMLGPRREVLAHDGIFAKCNSVFDDDCDGVPSRSDPDPNIAMRHRAPLHESELMAANWPGARYFLDAWYVIRDDANLYNTMGSREFTPVWDTTGSPSSWRMDLAGDATPMPKGAVIDRWVDPASTGAARNVEVVSPRGRLKLAMRATAIGNGRWRYDYALMNFDYADPVTERSESDVGGLRVVRNRGIAAIRLQVPGATTTESYDMHDGTGSGADDWAATRSADSVAFAAPAGNTLDWGSMYRYSFVADAPPVAGTATLDPFEPGAPDFSVATLVPRSSDVQFADGFESP